MATDSSLLISDFLSVYSSSDNKMMWLEPGLGTESSRNALAEVLLGTVALADANLHHGYQLALCNTILGLADQRCERLRDGQNSLGHPPHNGAIVPCHRGQLLYLILSAEILGAQLAALRLPVRPPFPDGVCFHPEHKMALLLWSVLQRRFEHQLFLFADAWPPP